MSIKIPDIIHAFMWSMSNRTSRAYIKQESQMNSKTESTVAILAALLVLFSAMWDPRISVAISVVALLGLGIYELVQNKK